MGKGPHTALKVQTLLNAALADRLVHGQPFTLRASVTPRKTKVSFALHCNSCHHASCKWTGRAFVTEGILHSTEISGEAHGRPKPDKTQAPAKSRGGRNLGGTRPALRCTEQLEYTGLAKQGDYHKFVEQHFQAKPVKHSLLVRCHARKPLKRGLVCVLTCSTHCSADGKKPCSWAGRAKLLRTDNPETQEVTWRVHLRYQPFTAHAPLQKQLFGTLFLIEKRRFL